MNQKQMCSIIEGLLYLTGEEGLTMDQIKGVIPDCSEKEIRNTVEKLKKDRLENKASGLMIVDLPDGYRMTTKPSMAAYAEKFTAIPQTAPLSQAALETVAIIAYKQPISRVAVEEVRGVKSERALHTLMAKGLIKEVGRAEGTGRAILYGITSVFLDYFGLHTIDDLPPLLNETIHPNEQLDAFDLFYDKYKETIKDL